MAYLPQSYVDGTSYLPDTELLTATDSWLPQHVPSAILSVATDVVEEVGDVEKVEDVGKVPSAVKRKIPPWWPRAAIAAGLLALLLSAGVYGIRKVTFVPAEVEPLPAPGFPLTVAQEKEIRGLKEEVEHRLDRFLKLWEESSSAIKDLFVSRHMRVADAKDGSAAMVLLGSYAQAFYKTELPKTDTEARVYKRKCLLVSSTIEAAITRLALLQERHNFAQAAQIPSAYLGLPGTPLPSVEFLRQSADHVSLQELILMATRGVRDTGDLQSIKIPMALARRLAGLVVDRSEHLRDGPEKLEECFRALRDEAEAAGEEVVVFDPLDKRPVNVTRLYKKVHELNAWRKSKHLTSEKLLEIAQGWTNEEDIVKTIRVLEREEYAFSHEESALKEKMKEELLTGSSAEQLIQVLIDLV